MGRGHLFFGGRCRWWRVLLVVLLSFVVALGSKPKKSFVIIDIGFDFSVWLNLTAPLAEGVDLAKASLKRGLTELELFQLFHRRERRRLLCRINVRLLFTSR